MKIAIQGILGSYHDEVAKLRFGDNSNIIECSSFDILVDSVKNKVADIGIMAIENSIAGSIIPNYSLIDNYDLSIIGEYYISINHQLMALPGIDYSSIETISSHPMALLQCKDFLKTTDKTIIESKDTAEVARMISDEKISTTAAIASPKAAEIYELNILMSNIQTISNNETRFVFISKNDNKDFQDLNKASLKIILSHESGSLAKILNIFNDYNINLTKVQSIPVIKTPWKYSFFIDLTFNKSDAFMKAIELVRRNSEFLKIFGIYKSFKKWIKEQKD